MWVKLYPWMLLFIQVLEVGEILDYYYFYQPIVLAVNLVSYLVISHNIIVDNT